MDQLIGKLLDNRYEILDTIGVGGMAMVYKAYCHRLHRFVAVKVLRKDLASDAEFRRRFHDEAQAVAMLSHPNIVSIYDVSRGEDLEYIVMELIDGITLKQYMKKKGGKLTWREAMHYITQILRALGHAHSRGIIHRDIKPQNIMVLRDGSVRVADFGIARVMSAAQNTLTQEALGSVHYISPEQARGSHIDERADLYSAGVVLYEMLTGRLPFEGDSPVSVAIQHISSIPLSPRELNPEIPEALESITLKAMASNVDRRYKNAEEMIRDLEDFRKNPNISFHYEDHGLLSSDEPTQVIDTMSLTSSLGKRRPPPRVADPASGDAAYEDYEDDYPTSRQRRDVARRPTKRRNNTILIISVVAVFLVAVGVFLWMFVFSDMFQKDTPLTVPNLVGQTYEEVMADKTITDAFKIVHGGTSASEDDAEGVIIDQTPKAKSEATGERPQISVVVSSGKPTFTMPDVVNKPYEEAVQELKDLKLEVKEPPESRADENIAANRVISSWPAKDAPMKAGDSVQLVISTGPEKKAVTVPTLTTSTRAQAEKMLKDIGLNGVFNEVNSDEAAGRVIYQSIQAGKEVEAGSTITLQVSKGPAAPVEKSQNITVTLPQEKESVVLRVAVGGNVQFNQTVSTAEGKIDVSVTGSGRQTIDIWIDDHAENSYDLDF